MVLIIGIRGMMGLAVLLCRLPSIIFVSLWKLYELIETKIGIHKTFIRTWRLFILAGLSAGIFYALFVHGDQEKGEKKTKSDWIAKMPESLKLTIIALPIAWGLWVWRNNDKLKTIEQTEEENRTNQFLTFTKTASDAQLADGVRAAALQGLKPYLHNQYGDEFHRMAWSFLQDLSQKLYERNIESVKSFEDEIVKVAKKFKNDTLWAIFMELTEDAFEKNLTPDKVIRNFNFSFMSLRNRNLEKYRFFNCVFINTHFEKINFEQCQFSAQMDYCVFHKCNMTDSRIDILDLSPLFLLDEKSLEWSCGKIEKTRICNLNIERIAICDSTILESTFSWSKSIDFLEGIILNKTIFNKCRILGQNRFHFINIHSNCYFIENDIDDAKVSFKATIDNDNKCGKKIDSYRDLPNFVAAPKNQDAMH